MRLRFRIMLNLIHLKNMNDKQNKQLLSERIFSAEFKEAKGTFGLKNNKAYYADGVDLFLTEIGGEVEKLEDLTGKLINFYNKHKNTNPVNQQVKNEEKQEPLFKGETVDNVSVKNTKLEKIHNHISELLIVAEEKAEAVTLDAEAKSRNMIEEAKAKAASIIQQAQARASEIENESNEKMSVIVKAKKDLEQRAENIKQDFNVKADELEKYGSQLSAIANNVRMLTSK